MFVPERLLQLNVSHPAAQAVTTAGAAVRELGVDFIKIDCIADHPAKAMRFACSARHLEKLAARWF
jgi:hypothetical protein